MHSVEGSGFGHSLEKMGANTRATRALFIGCALNRLA